MSPRGNRPFARVRHACALAIAGLLVAACSGSGSAEVATPTSAVNSATATPAATKGPATQNLVLGGPAGKAGAITLAGIRCDVPTLNAGQTALEISVLAEPEDPNLSVYIFVQQGSLTVRYDSGSGSTYIERDFSGTGVTSFDPASGATIDSPLTEVQTTGAHGTLGELTSIKGTIDCGNQMPGSSTVSVSGSTPKGTISAAGLSPVNVECTSSVTNGRGVSADGIIQVGSTPYFAILFITPGTFTFFASGDAFFRSTSAGGATLTATGAHVDGDVVEQNPPKGTTAHTVHITGDLTCGTTVAN